MFFLIRIQVSWNEQIPQSSELNIFSSILFLFQIMAINNLH